MKKDLETIWVLRKDENTPQLIKAHRFNSEFHKKLFWKNVIRESKQKISEIQFDVNNPWLVGIGVAMFTIILSAVFL
jgi:hypothetical protein